MSRRAGIVGGGFMAEVHARSIRVAGGTPAALVSSSRERGRAAADRLGIERALPDLETMLADPTIDVVHICTPNALHAAMARAALLAGKHVVCEKPLGVSGGEAGALAELARLTGKVAAVPFVYRFHPMVREARARIASGEAGEITTIAGSYLQDWLLLPSDDNWRVDRDAGGPSRAFADIGSHLVDLIEFVTGERIVGLSARVRTVHPVRAGSPVATEDLAALLIETERGALGSLMVSQVAPGRKNALVLEVAGARESLRFEQERPEELWIGRRRGSRLHLRNEEELAADAARVSAAPSGHPLGYLDAFAAFVSDAYAAIGRAVPDGLPTFDDGVRAARITDAVLESALAEAWVEIDPQDEGVQRRRVG